MDNLENGWVLSDSDPVRPKVYGYCLECGGPIHEYGCMYCKDCRRAWLEEEEEEDD